MFRVDERLVADARAALAGRTGLRFVVGGAGAGKSVVCRLLAGRHRLDVLDVDARLYGSWHGTFEPSRHPANTAWSTAADPLGWQLRLDPGAFLAFHDAATAEALDLLAGELADAVPGRPLLVDGGFASVGVLARVVPPRRIVCLSLPPESPNPWTATRERRGFLEEVAAVRGVDDPLGRFLGLDAALSARMVADARAAGVPVVERAAGDAPDATATRVGALLGLD